MRWFMAVLIVLLCHRAVFTLQAERLRVAREMEA